LAIDPGFDVNALCRAQNVSPFWPDLKKAAASAVTLGRES